MRRIKAALLKVFRWGAERILVFSKMNRTPERVWRSNEGSINN